MPRRSPDVCMFCEPDEPCEAHKKVEKPKRTRRTEIPMSEPKSQHMPDLSELPRTAPPAPAVDLRAAMRTASESRHDLEFASALVVLEPILHPDERRKYADVMAQVSSAAERWKARNRRG